MSDVCKIEVYQTIDGKIFKSKNAATQHMRVLKVKDWYIKNPLIDCSTSHAVSYNDIFDWATRHDLTISDAHNNLIPIEECDE